MRAKDLLKIARFIQSLAEMTKNKDNTSRNWLSWDGDLYTRYSPDGVDVFDSEEFKCDDGRTITTYYCVAFDRNGNITADFIQYSLYCLFHGWHGPFKIGFKDLWAFLFLCTNDEAFNEIQMISEEHGRLKRDKIIELKKNGWGEAEDLLMKSSLPYFDDVSSKLIEFMCVK
jgi:hypothetical protein